MLLQENDELLIFDIMNDVKKYFETKDTKYVSSFRKNISYALKNKPNDFINHIYDLLDTYYQNNDYDEFIDNQLNTALHYEETEDKQYIVLAIPFLMIGYHSTTDLEFVRRREHFDNRLFKLKIDLEYILSKKLNTEYNAKLRLHDSLMDLSQLYQNYKDIFSLKNDLTVLNKNELDKKSILLKKTNETYDINKQDNLKFIVGIIEFDKNEDVEFSLNNSFDYILKDYETLNSKFQDLLINQQIATDELIMLPPRPLMSAIENGWQEFHYQILYGLVKQVVDRTKKNELIINIVYMEEEEVIHLFFNNIYNEEEPFYRIEVKHGVIDFEEEIKVITDIINDFEVNFRLIRK
jgi:hypothetical protein